MLKPRVLVLTGEGINCENETALAFNEAGGEATIQTLSDLIERPENLHNYDILAIPGGFSYGDEIGSGQVFSIKLKKYLERELEKFVADKKPIVGICNGFQILIKLGLFEEGKERHFGLAPNTSGQFIDKWVGLKVDPKSPCIWTKGLTEGELPIRHGEGRLVSNLNASNLESFIDGGQAVLTYKADVNGSINKIAGLTDKTGLILGFMPHPEAAVFNATAPKPLEDKKGRSWGYQFFKNSIEYVLSQRGEL